MFVRNIKEFKKKTNKKKIICLDCGKIRVGIAISDENHNLSMPMLVIKRNKEFNRKIKNILINYNVGGILVGLPIDNKKKINKISQFIIDITKNLDFYLLNNNLDVPFFFWDESFTSIEAEDLTEGFYKNKKQQKKNLDKFAATVILDDYMNDE